MKVVAVDHRFGDLALERELIEPAGGEVVDAAAPDRTIAHAPLLDTKVIDVVS